MKHATSPPLSENAVSASPFADVARFIGPDAPTWLVGHFARWSPSLMLDRFIEKEQPTKAETKKRLAKIRKATLVLRKELNDTPIREFLEIAPSDPIEYRVALEHILQDFAGRVERAMTSPALSTEDGKTRPGHGKAMPAPTFPRSGMAPPLSRRGCISVAVPQGPEILRSPLRPMPFGAFPAAKRQTGEKSHSTAGAIISRRCKRRP